MESNTNKVKEIWKYIAGFNGEYMVSNTGRVKSVNRTVVFKDGRKRFYEGKFIKQQKTKKGYLFVILSNNRKSFNRYVHRLVADAFIPKIEGLSSVNHLDGCKTNNAVDNLEWCNNSMNMRHAVRLGLAKPNILAAREKHMKKVIQLTKSGELIAEYISVKQAADANSCNLSNIARCCRCCYGSKTYKGYIWKYK